MGKNKDNKKNEAKSNKSETSKDVRVNTDATSTRPNADHGMKEC